MLEQPPLQPRVAERPLRVVRAEVRRPVDLDGHGAADWKHHETDGKPAGAKGAARYESFAAGRKAVYYDEALQTCDHLHFPGDSHHRILQNFYSFAFFADPLMASFYRRFVRDYARYRDEIQCAGAELVAAIRMRARAPA